MRIKILPIVFVLVSMGVASIAAQEPPKASNSDRIITTFEMREDALREFKIADSQLNKVFQQLLSRLNDKSQSQKLKVSQRAWLKFRDSYAEFEASFYEGGTIQIQFHTNFLTKMTQARTKELQETLETEFDH